MKHLRCCSTSQDLGEGAGGARIAACDQATSSFPSKILRGSHWLHWVMVLLGFGRSVLPDKVCTERDLSPESKVFRTKDLHVFARVRYSDLCLNQNGTCSIRIKRICEQALLLPSSSIPQEMRISPDPASRCEPIGFVSLSFYAGPVLAVRVKASFCT